MTGPEGARPGQNRDNFLSRVEAPDGAPSRDALPLWLLVAGLILAGAAAVVQTDGKTAPLTREEALTGIRLLWEEHAAALPRTAARQLGATYARYSTKGQSSVLDQVRTCLEFAAREGIFVPFEHIYFDLGVSGRKARRAGYEALEECLKAKQVQALLVFTTNRLHRRATRALDYVECLVQERRIRVVFVMNHIDSENDERWKNFLRFLVLYDEFAAEMYVEHIRASHIGKLLGRLVFGTITFGYRGVEVPGAVSRKGKPARRIEIDPAEAAVVRRVFHAFVEESRTIRAIIRMLNADSDVPPPRKGRGRWTRLAVLTLLRNDRYRGLWSYGERESVLLPSKDYIRQVERDEPLKQARFEELRIVPDELFFRAQERLAGLRPDRGRTPREVNAAGLPPILNGLFWCPAHEQALTVAGSKSGYLACPACDLEPPETRPLYSQLHRATALERLCVVLDEAIRADADLVGQVIEWFRRAAEQLQAPDPAQCEVLKERKQRLTRSVKLLARQEPGSDAEERELEAALGEKGRDLARVEAELARLANAANREVHVPTNEEAERAVGQIAETLLRTAAEGTPEDVDALRGLLERLTSGRIELFQCGERKPRRGCLEGRFRAPLAAAVAQALGEGFAAADDAGVEIRVEFRREASDAEQMECAWELYQQDTPHKAIATALGCSKSNVTRLLRKAAELHGVTLEDGRKRRGRLPRAEGEPPPTYIQIGDRAVELWNAGKSYREIARACECSDMTAEKAVRHWRESRGLPVPDPESRRAERLELAERLHGEGLSWDEVAERLGISAATLRSWRAAAA